MSKALRLRILQVVSGRKASKAEVTALAKVRRLDTGHFEWFGSADQMGHRIHVKECWR